MTNDIDPRFGRCGYFLFIDSESGELEAVNNNDTKNLSGRAGVQSAELAAGKNADVLITGHCGKSVWLISVGSIIFR